MTGPEQAKFPAVEHEIRQALEWLADGSPIVMASVISTWGSSPRPVGSHLFVNAAGSFTGSVSSGCIEGAVVQEALDLLTRGGVKRLSFQVGQEQAWDVGLSCGGAIEIYLQRLTDAALLSSVATALTAGRPEAIITALNDGRTEVYPRAVEFFNFPQQLSGEAAALVDAGKSGWLAGERGRDEASHDYFLRLYHPPISLILIGAVHISQVLAPMAIAAGWQTVVVDPRAVFANKQRFPDTPLCVQWPDECLAPLLNASSALVTLSHDPKIDDLALAAALNSDAFYIGALGSKSTHAQRLERLAALGFGESFQRICAPVGLDLGGREPEHIAIAILAQIVQARFRGGQNNAATQSQVGAQIEKHNEPTSGGEL